MERHNFTQGSNEWLAHRANCYNASDAPAMLGCSAYETRSQLLHRMHTGITPEVDSNTQRLFDEGHHFEDLARPLAEEIIGEDLGRVVGSIDAGFSRRIGASFDGLTFMGDVCFEHKRLNATLRNTFEDIENGFNANAALDKMYRVQMEHQLWVSGADRVLFMASEWKGDTLVEEHHCWYESDPELQAEIIAGWKQFDADLAAYVPPAAAAPAAVAKVVAALPVVLDMRVEGKLIACNLEQFKPAAMAYIGAINTTLTTDQDFADADADAKFCRESASKLKLAIEQALGQMGDINTAISTVREIAAAFDAKGLALEKLVKSEKDARRENIVTGGAKALRDHIASLNERLGKPYMPAVPVDFAGVIKGKRNLDSMQDAVDTELARAKIAANEIADRIEGNLRTVNAKPGLLHLYPDIATVALKQRDDFEALVQAREAQHRQAEDARLEQERERMRKEEADRLEREAAEQKRQADLEAARQAQQAIANAAAPAQQPLNPADVKVEPIYTQAGGFAPIRATGVRATHIPTGTVVEATEDRSAHGNRARAFDQLQEAVSRQPTDTGERIRLGELNARISPLSITADGLASLGFTHVATDKAAKLYREADMPAICAALIQVLSKLSGQSASEKR